MNKLVNCFATYRKECAPNSQPSQLVLSDCMKVVPLYCLSLMKTHAVRLMTSSQNLDKKVFEA